MKNEVKISSNSAKPTTTQTVNKEQALKKQKQKVETQKFKSKYFEFYDDIKISDRQDW